MPYHVPHMPKEAIMINQAWLVHIHHSVIYIHGYQVPCTAQEVIELDKKNGNTKW